eukprot:2080351-Rhodomonas_salina.1
MLLQHGNQGLAFSARERAEGLEAKIRTVERVNIHRAEVAGVGGAGIRVGPNLKQHGRGTEHSDSGR